jgi:hypothetical protein
MVGGRKSPLTPLFSKGGNKNGARVTPPFVKGGRGDLKINIYIHNNNGDSVSKYSAYSVYKNSGMEWLGEENPP